MASQENDWIEWRGAKWDASPVAHDTHIEVKFRDGTVTDLSVPQQFRWDHSDEATEAHADIVAYRVVSA